LHFACDAPQVFFSYHRRLKNGERGFHTPLTEKKPPRQRFDCLFSLCVIRPGFQELDH
jgi:hypothetical protein